MTSIQSVPLRKVLAHDPTVVQSRVDLPNHVYFAYADQAQTKGKDPEVLMAERLIQCQGHNDQGLWFSATEKKRLELCLGHACSDAAGALQRLEPLSKITVEGLEIRIDPVVLKRLSTRTLRGQTLEQLIRQQVDKALKAYVGLLPL